MKGPACACRYSDATRERPGQSMMWSVWLDSNQRSPASKAGRDGQAPLQTVNFGRPDENRTRQNSIDSRAPSPAGSRSLREQFEFGKMVRPPRLELGCTGHAPLKRGCLPFHHGRGVCRHQAHRVIVWNAAADIATMIEANGAGLSFRATLPPSVRPREERFSPDRMCRASLMVAEAGNAR